MSFEEGLQVASDFIRQWMGPLLASEPAQYIMAPGMVFIELLHVPQNTGTLLAALLVGYYFWLWLIRGMYFSIGRRTGLASTMRHYGVFTRLWLPWQGPYQKYLIWRGFKRQVKEFGGGGSQGWAGFWNMASLPFDPARNIPVGRLPILQRFGLYMPVSVPDGGKHIAYVSYSGGGKSSQLAAWLGTIHKRGSAAVFDMDGAFVNAFGAVLEKAGHKVVKFDPDRLAKGFDTFGHWNPFDELTVIKNRLGPEYVIEFAHRFAEALIVQDSQSQPVFAMQARVFVKALILWVWLMEEEKTLKRFRVLLNRGMPELDLGEKTKGKEKSGFSKLLFAMNGLADAYKAGMVDDGCKGAICEAISNAQSLMSGADGSATRDNPDAFKKTALYQTAWIDDVKIHEMTAYSDISGLDLKYSNAVVFMVSTLDDMQGRLGPLMRAFITITLYQFQKVEPDKVLNPPCSFILDELPNCGKIDILETAIGGFRKFGARLVIATQSVGLMKKAYPETYMEFFNQAQTIVWMGIAPTDQESLEVLCYMLGKADRRKLISGYRLPARMLARLIGLKLAKAQYQTTKEALLEPPEAAAFLNRATGQIIVTREGGQWALRLKKLEYWRDLALWEYQPHKGFPETFWRRTTRSALTTLAEVMDVKGEPQQ